MLLQSQTLNPDGSYEIQLLPSLPAAFPEGSVAGLCARGGFVIDLAWKDGKITSAEVLSKNGGKLRLCAGEYQFEAQTKAGEMIQLAQNLVKKK